MDDDNVNYSICIFCKEFHSYLWYNYIKEDCDDPYISASESTSICRSFVTRQEAEEVKKHIERRFLRDDCHHAFVIADDEFPTDVRIRTERQKKLQRHLDD